SYSRISKTPSGSHRTYGSSQPYNNAGARRFTRPPRITPLETTCKHSYQSALPNTRRSPDIRKPTQTRSAALQLLKFISISSIYIQTAPTVAHADQAQGSFSQCEVLLPVTAMLSGFIGADLRCPGTIFWNAEPGVLLYGFERPDAYLETSAGVAYPSSSGDTDDNNRFKWNIRTAISYVFVRPQSFASLADVQPKFTIQSPGLQQWAILANSKVSTEIWTRNENLNFYLSSWGFEFWQSLPPQWRGLGALRYTQKAQLSGFNLTGHRNYGPWRISSTLGFSSIAIERSVFTLFHPTIELKYLLRGIP
ncbi:MAG: hypothetical protein RJB13_388, partial [Pseudomonadota bacterium]